MTDNDATQTRHDDATDELTDMLKVDAVTLDRLAPTLNTFGWYKREETADKNGFNRDMGFECVRCGAMTDDYMYAPDDIGHITRFNYCPCCGAKLVNTWE